MLNNDKKTPYIITKLKNSSIKGSVSFCLIPRCGNLMRLEIWTFDGRNFIIVRNWGIKLPFSKEFETKLKNEKVVKRLSWDPTYNL